MNAPLIWIGLPAAGAIIMLAISRWKRLTVVLGVSLSLTLAGLAWLLPVGKLIHIGILTIEINPVWTILGRRFTLESSDRPLVIFFNLALAFWFIAASECDVFAPFIALGTAMSAILTAAILVQPFYYGVIFLLIAMVLGVGMLASGSRDVGAGMIRFLVFQTFGMPILLLIGWMMGNIEINPAETTQLFTIRLLTSIGFGLILAIFPFHSWLGMIAEESHPLLLSYLLFILPFATNIFAIIFIQQSTWLRESLWITAFFRLSGFLMTLIGGLGAASHQHLGKLTSYAIMVAIGMIQLVISLGIVASESASFLAIIFPLLFGNMISLGLLGLSLSILKGNFHTTDLPANSEVGTLFPYCGIAIFVALLSLAGFPVTGGFPVHLIIWQNLFFNFPLGGVSSIVGSLGILIGSVRALSVLMHAKGKAVWTGSENSYQKILLGIGILALIILGLFPQIYVPLSFNLGLTFMMGR